MLRSPHEKSPRHASDPVLGDITRADLEQLNRISQARNLRGVLQTTKWLNFQAVELMKQYPADFQRGTGVSVEEYVRALQVHVDVCRVLLEKF